MSQLRFWKTAPGEPMDGVGPYNNEHDGNEPEDTREAAITKALGDLFSALFCALSEEGVRCGDVDDALIRQGKAAAMYREVVETNTHVQEVARKHAVPGSTLRRWRSKVMGQLRVDVRRSAMEILHKNAADRSISVGEICSRLHEKHSNMRLGKNFVLDEVLLTLRVLERAGQVSINESHGYRLVGKNIDFRDSDPNRILQGAVDSLRDVIVVFKRVHEQVAVGVGDAGSLRSRIRWMEAYRPQGMPPEEFNERIARAMEREAKCIENERGEGDTGILTRTVFAARHDE